MEWGLGRLSPVSDCETVRGDLPRGAKVPITTKVEIQSVKTASWIVGSNPFGGDSNRLAGYIVHIACPRFVCKYVVDEDKDLYYCVEFDDGDRAPIKFGGGMEYGAPKFEGCTLTVFDMVWIDPKPESIEAEENLLGTIHAVVQAFLSDDPEQKAKLIRDYCGV